jgi:pimeloyl-ACP methyl ester carboxylesterase
MQMTYKITSMTYATTDDGVRLYYEQSGSGTPLLFIHEFAGDHRSWAPQVAHFSDRYRCIVYGARGYPPSDVPADPDVYSMERAVADAVAILDEVGAEKAHVVGISMGGFTSMHLGRLHPDRLLSLTSAACGYGAQPSAQERFRGECENIAAAYDEEGADGVASWYSLGPARVQFQDKNPEAWQVFADQLAEHDALGARNTMLGVQRKRPSLYDLADELAAIEVPTLIVAGDEDDGVLETDLWLKRTMPAASLSFLPRTGHTCNLEEPEVFNGVVGRFLASVDDGTWMMRDPRSLSSSITGADEK